MLPNLLSIQAKDTRKRQAISAGNGTICKENQHPKTIKFGCLPDQRRLVHMLWKKLRRPFALMRDEVIKAFRENTKIELNIFSEIPKSTFDVCAAVNLFK